MKKEKEQQSEQYEQTVQRLQAKHETDMSHLHQEHALSATKVHITTTPPCDPPSLAPCLINRLLIDAKYKSLCQM